MSMRAYTVRRKMNQLRRHACTLWQTPGVAQVITKVEIEIEKKGLIIRKDKSLNKDVGMKKSFLELLLSYNPLWLKIGLETIYGELLTFTASDAIGLSQFILTRMLSNPDIQTQFAHPHVPHHFGPGYEEALKQYTLKKFLQVVFFLDQAKSHRLIKHDPCLFCKDSKVKMSKDILVQFSRDFLAGEGDVIKHLAYLGFLVNHKQTPLDEFDYAVTNLAVDLKDGIRLRNTGNGIPKDIDARSVVDGHMEKTLSLMWHIIYGFQLDRILNEGRLQTEVKHLFKSLEYRRQIGDQEAAKGLDFILDCKRRSLAEEFGKTPAIAPLENDWMNSSKIKLLLEWARLVCAHYGLEVENLTVSFSDGRCLCFMLHHYYPSFLPRDQIQMRTMMAQQQGSPASSNSPNLNCSLDDSFGAMTYSFGRTPQLYDELLNNEKANFKLIHDKINELGGVPLLIRSGDMSNTIPDQKVTTTFLIYLAARLLDLSVEMTAARTIQLAWRKYHVNQVEKQIKAMRRRKVLKAKADYVLKFKAATIIQRAWKRFQVVQKYQVMNQSATTIQGWYRQILAKRVLTSLLVAKRQQSCVKIQSWIRMALIRQDYLKRKRSSILIQKLFRGHKIRNQFSMAKQIAHETVLPLFKSIDEKLHYCLHSIEQFDQRAIEKAQLVRKYLVANQFENDEDASLSNALHRTFSRIQMQRIESLEKSAIILQRCVRDWFQRLHNAKMNESSQLIQRWYRRTKKERKKFVRILETVIVIQKRCKGLLVRKSFEAVNEVSSWTSLPVCETKEQKVDRIRDWISKITMISRRQLKSALIGTDDVNGYELALRKHHHKLVHRQNLKFAIAANLIQASIVRWLNVLRFRRRTHAALVIQKFYSEAKTREALKLEINRRISHKRLLALINQRRRLRASVLIQRAWRERQSRLAWQRRNDAAIAVQCWFRRICAKEILHQLIMEHRNRAAVKLQTWMRMCLARKQFLRLLRATLIFQKAYRGQKLRKTIRLTHMITNATLLPLHLPLTAKNARFLENLPNLCVDAGEISLCHRIIECLHPESDYQTCNDFETAVILCHQACVQKRVISCHEASILIQRSVRGWLAQTRFSRQRQSAIVIQQFYKKNMARRNLIRIITKRILVKRKAKEIAIQRERNQAATVLQSHWRRFVLRTQFLSLRRSCLLIQAIARRKILKIKAEQELRVQSAFIIQRAWKRLQSKREWERNNCAAISIQCWIQSSLRDKIQKAKAHHELEIKAANIIQRACRRYRAAQRWKLMRKAAIVIQCWFRQILARKVLCQLVFARQDKSALSIQRAWKRYRVVQQWKSSNASATTIQCWYRQILAKRARDYLVQRRRETSACAIQKAWKRFQVARKWKSRNVASIRIQCWYRRVLATRVLRNLLHVRRETSALKIQRAWKRYRVVQQWKSSNACATTIQCWYRQILARRALHQLRESRRATAATQIQRAWRRHQCIQNFKFKNFTAIKIQCWFRQILARRAVKKLLLHRRVLSAFKIQGAWRKHRARECARKRKNAIVSIQCWYRQSLARRTLETLRAERNEQLYQERVKVAGLSVQSAMRMWVVRKQFVRIRRAVVLIQRVYRGHRVREAFKVTCKVKQEVLLPNYDVNEELGKKIEQARQKVQTANQNATEDKKLGNRTALALDCLYTSRDMAQLLQILNDLDVSTRFSANCCDQIVAEKDRCIRILLDLLLRCNRSIPHMELISTTLDVFISLAKYEPSRVILNGIANDLVGTIMEVLHIFYKDKFVDIYTKGLALLWLLSFDDNAQTIMRSANVTKKILEMHKFYHRIHSKQLEQERRRSNYLPAHFKKSQAKFKIQKLSLCPPWKMRSHEICHHKEPFLASEVVLKRLALKPLPLP
ncbi:hypothetical protein TCAL_08689 [Tigriopus californicus]|uniref:Calponin-homology (CH) domain-containing protein n=1 Tax=Tigriopus californicus TaxID=6832 RepID=A0A553NB63_TIGCA|nr:hypothetical protein TCAL_08689 [Tigriopus californicus]